jgi:hypothetical protein
LLAIMADGKAVRDATDAEGNQFICSPPPPTTTLVVGQVEVGAKSNEVRAATLANTR